MRLFFVVLSSVLFLSACVSSETSITTKNTGAGHATQFDPKGAAETRVKLALVYLRKSNMQQAKENLDKALEYQPNDANIYRIFAYYYQRVNENDTAEEYYKKSLRIDSKNADTYNNYGTFLCKLARYKEAEKAFVTAVEQSTYTGVANTYENAAVCAEKAGVTEKALYYYQYALSHNPNKSYINLSLAKLNIDEKEYAAARLNLFNFQKKSKTNAESLWQWIRLSYATEKGASLSKYAGQLLEQFPDSERALDYLNHEYY
ncbi:type IV pilus biogenesis/stability protein PilW [Psychromonas sp. Urea-02u-13]|uniref:type IV pilus biogenesis/stability protein PilW n=1 Tax=Psychromonas sp. Urea-02u-13 TaxID=2058326 RepID=UPI000C342DEA|nr:type IV pilus biogenesis/stability protein PilW [Psychromonas sp. Urea-02u-13]PKG40408.1 type IV pilus biogenesis/stability protein PilW [Psychromonas sp. Urea-02u-13]